MAGAALTRNTGNPAAPHCLLRLSACSGFASIPSPPVAGASSVRGRSPLVLRLLDVPQLIGSGRAAHRATGALAGISSGGDILPESMLAIPYALGRDPTASGSVLSRSPDSHRSRPIPAGAARGATRGDGLY
jgi:hypothetical protein